jgi:hypothetical protein
MLADLCQFNARIWGPGSVLQVQSQALARTGRAATVIRKALGRRAGRAGSAIRVTGLEHAPRLEFSRIWRVLRASGVRIRDLL